MEYKNLIQLRGVVKSAETVPYGQKHLCKFTVLTRYAYSGRNGDNVFEDTLHHCTAFSGQKIPVETLRKIQSGSVVYVTGRQRHIRKKLDDGRETSRAEVYVSDVTVHKAASNELNISQSI